MNQYDLSRYVTAQQRDYQSALTEIKNGKKVSHWMWYIFPQIRGLGKSSTSQFYAIQSLDEAKAFLEHPYLGHNIIEISEALLSLDTSDAYEVFGKPDNMKLKSSMTLFARASQKIHIRIRLRTVNQLFFYSLIHIFSFNEPLSYNHPDYR